MDPDNTVADRLLGDAPAPTPQNQSPRPGKIAMIIGIVALVVSPISIAGWIVGAAAVGTGVTALRRPVPPKQARIGIALGAAAILVGVFFYTLALTIH